MCEVNRIARPHNLPETSRSTNVRNGANTMNQIVKVGRKRTAVNKQNR